MSNLSKLENQQIGSLCYKNEQELPPLDFNTTCSIRGRYVIFYNDRLNGTSYPREYEKAAVFTELCEVTVLGIVILCFPVFLLYIKI